MSFYGKAISGCSILTAALNALSALLHPTSQSIASAVIICLMAVVIVFSQLTIRSLEQIVRGQS